MKGINTSFNLEKNKPMNFSFFSNPFKKVLPGLFVAVSFASFAQEQSPEGIQFFHGTFAELKSKAASAQKPIFMDAYTTWCGPCKWMAKTVFTTKEAGDFYNQNFICAKVDMEKGEGIELAKSYEVNAYPTLLFLNAAGEVIHRSLGALDAAKFIELGKTASNPEINLAGLKKKHLQSPADFNIAYSYFFMLSDASLTSELASGLNSWFSQQPASAWMERQNWKLLFDFVENPDNAAFQNMVANRQEFASRYTADSVNGKARKVYFSDLQNTAYNGDLARWKKDSAAITQLNLKDGQRFIASTTIIQAGDDINLALSRIMKFMKDFGSENPGELNEYAWKMFEASENKEQLAAAESWAKKGLELSGGDFMIHDTYANLLYKSKKLSLAKAEAAKAIERGKKDGQDVSSTEMLLASIEEELKKSASKPVVKPAVKSRAKKK
jgi:thioredoxin-related protein